MLKDFEMTPKLQKEFDLLYLKFLINLVITNNPRLMIEKDKLNEEEFYDLAIKYRWFIGEIGVTTARIYPEKSPMDRHKTLLDIVVREAEALGKLPESN